MTIEIEIEKLVPPGIGLGYHNNKAVFVEGSVKGDVINATILKEKKRHIIAQIESVITPGPNRVLPPCPHYDACGGCSLMQLSYADQVQIKRLMMIETFAGFELQIDPAFVASPEETQFRYRTTVHLENGNVGFKGKHSHQITNIESCKILSRGLMDQLPKLKTLGRNHCQFSLIEANSSQNVAITVSSKQSTETLPGYSATVFEDYGYGQIKLHSNGFAQSNPFITRLICDDLLAKIEENDEISELYCGCGTFSIPLAKKVRSLEGFDLSKNAISLAKENAELNKIAHTRFESINLEKAHQFEFHKTVIVDPPRKGLSQNLLRQMGKSEISKIIYISCDPSSLARDSKSLIENQAFALTSIAGYDMYCHSAHTEAMAVFER